jgi:hypothetical protein
VRELLASNEALKENEDEDAVNNREEDLDKIAFNGSSAC